MAAIEKKHLVRDKEVVLSTRKIKWQNLREFTVIIKG